jgi:pimeloyl-ACP methyl ester carboxylesterase
MALLVVFGLVLATAWFVRRDVPVADLLPRYGGGASRFVVLDGMNVHYRDEGSGEPLVLLHGTSSSLHTWDGWVSRLASKRRVVRLDLPGAGLTGPSPDRDYAASRVARVVVALMNELGIDRADVAGNSSGGRVAIQLALAAPARVRSLILIDSRGLAGAKPTAFDSVMRAPILSRAILGLAPRALFRRSLRGLYGDPARLGEDVVARYDDLLRREGNRAAMRDMFGAPDETLDDRLGEIQAPVLVEWGERDPRIPVAFGRLFAARIRGARLIVYADAGHVPMEESPDESARDAEAFLEARR